MLETWWKCLISPCHHDGVSQLHYIPCVLQSTRAIRWAWHHRIWVGMSSCACRPRPLSFVQGSEIFYVIPLGKGQASETGMEPSLTLMYPKYCFFATFHVHFFI